MLDIPEDAPELANESFTQRLPSQN
jgi:hypothetical protein